MKTVKEKGFGKVMSVKDRTKLIHKHSEFKKRCRALNVYYPEVSKCVFGDFDMIGFYAVVRVKYRGKWYLSHCWIHVNKENEEKGLMDFIKDIHKTQHNCKKVGFMIVDPLQISEKERLNRNILYSFLD